MRALIPSLVLLTLCLAMVGCGDDGTPFVVNPPKLSIEKPEDLIDALETAYRNRDVDLFESLLANDPDNNAEYLFFLVEPTAQGEEQWGFTEEMRIHKRMFRPGDLDPGEPEIDPDLWLQAINISLTQATPFDERLDLYVSSSNPDGLDPEKWRATDSRYGTFVFFDTVSDNDFLVEG